jgi:hypothetical protein
MIRFLQVGAALMAGGSIAGCFLATGIDASLYVVKALLWTLIVGMLEILRILWRPK